MLKISTESDLTVRVLGICIYKKLTGVIFMHIKEWDPQWSLDKILWLTLIIWLTPQGQTQEPLFMFAYIMLCLQNIENGVETS